nr:hypothetical protein [Tanacetum cinerariifolium]
MSSPTHPASDIKDVFSSNSPDYISASLDYFSASSGNISPNSSNDLTKYLLTSLAISPYQNDMYIIQAYDDILPPQAIIALPAILPLSLVLSLPPMFDSQDFFSSEKISPPKDTETPVKSPILVSPSSSVGSSSPISTMCSPNHPTSDIKDAFSSNFHDYFLATSGNNSPNSSDDFTKDEHSNKHLTLDLTGNKDPTDEDGDTGMGDLTGVLVSLGGEIFSGSKKSRESNIGGSDNT